MEVQGSSLSAGTQDQACNECKRRKARCNRRLPECDPCARNKRHCLYERYGKTPLTRKHLTTVEEKLRQSERRLKIAEQRAQQAEARLQVQQPLNATPAAISFRESDAADKSQPLTAMTSPSSEQFQVQHVSQPSLSQSTHSFAGQALPKANATTNTFQKISQPGENAAIGIGISCHQHIHSYETEVSPLQEDDLSWNEQSPSKTAGSRENESEHDGMASLPPGGKRAGYLGTASGAAMMRLLVSSTEHDGTVTSHRSSPERQSDQWIASSVYNERNIGDIDMDAAVKSYFENYHVSYPLVHEPTFRAQYARVIKRPNGTSWNALAYMVMAVGVFTSTESSNRDLDLCEAAKANISMSTLESGNITLVQALALMSNYLQKRDKPNSGYHYLGIALTMAMGIGLHREFDAWRTTPMLLEIRRRVWWTLFVLYSGAMVTFGRPSSWPAYGVDIALPLNVDDRALTHATKMLPTAAVNMTVHSAVAAQARFHLATNDIYARVISTETPSASEMIGLDDDRIEPWRKRWADEFSAIPAKYLLSHSVMEWRYRNFRILMYRPFLIKHVLHSRSAHRETVLHGPTNTALERCLEEASASIDSISTFWNTQPQSRLSAWYSLYFAFQASLIPLLMLRNEPTSALALGWRDQLLLVLQITDSMKAIIPSSRECHQVILRLCGSLILIGADERSFTWNDSRTPVDEMPVTQLANVYPMLWPNASVLEHDLTGIDNLWMSSAFDGYLEDFM